MKDSEYRREFEAKKPGKIPGTDVNLYERPAGGNQAWQRVDLPTEKISSCHRQYPGATAPADKLARDRETRAGFKDRNGRIVGNQFASMESTSHLRRSFVSPDVDLRQRHQQKGLASGSQSRAGSARSLAVRFPYGYRSPLEGKTTYEKAFTDPHVRHCLCPN